MGRASYNKKKSKKLGLKRSEEEYMMPPITAFASGKQQNTWCNFNHFTVMLFLDVTLYSYYNNYEKDMTLDVGLSACVHFVCKICAYLIYLIESGRQSDWDSIVACHRGEAAATTWNFSRKCMGSHRLLHDRYGWT